MRAWKIAVALALTTGCGSDGDAADEGGDGGMMSSCVVECPEGLETLTVEGEHLEVASPEDVDALSGVECVDGLLIIRDDVSDLTPLSSLQGVTGGFLISSASGLQSLDGLQALRAVGENGLAVSNNMDLRTLDGLQGLECVGLLFDIAYNPVLESTASLTSLRATPVLQLKSNQQLEEIRGLNALVDLTAIVIQDHPSLTSVRELGAAGAMDVLRVEGTGLQTLDAFSKLSQLTGLEIDMNPELTSLEGLENLAGVIEGVHIVANKKLPSDAARAFAAAQSPMRVKVDGNAGDSVHSDECPWAEDGECDEMEPAQLCAPGLDKADCEDMG